MNELYVVRSKARHRRLNGGHRAVVSGRDEPLVRSISPMKVAAAILVVFVGPWTSQGSEHGLVVGADSVGRNRVVGG